MQRSSTWQRLPGPLWVMLATFAVVPLWSLSLPEQPWDGDMTSLSALVAIFAFWLAPIAICLTIVRRSFILIPLFWLECLALLAHAIQDASSQPPAMQTIRYMLIGLMAALGTALLRRDIIYPLIKNDQRGWRRAPRLALNYPAQLWQDDANTYVQAMIENCSATGMAVSTSASHGKPLLRTKRKGDGLKLRLKYGQEVLTVDAELMWYETREPFVRMGLSVPDEAVLQRVLTHLSAGQKTMRARLARLWASKAMRLTLYFLWAITVGAALSVPACGRVEADAAPVKTVDLRQDEAAGEMLDVEFSLSAASLATDGLSLANDTLTFDGNIVDCKSGFGKALLHDGPQLLQVPKNDMGCHIALSAIWRNGDPYRLGKGVAFIKGPNASNTFYSTSGDILTVITTTDFPSPVVSAAKLQFHIVEVDTDSSKTITVPLPATACTISVVMGGRNNQYPVATVKVHPVYLPYATRLTVLLCSSTKKCTTFTTTSPAIVYSNVYTATDKGSTPTVTATLEINNIVIRQQVAAENKSLSCQSGTGL